MNLRSSCAEVCFFLKRLDKLCIFEKRRYVGCNRSGYMHRRERLLVEVLLDFVSSFHHQHPHLDGLANLCENAVHIFGYALLIRRLAFFSGVN